MEFPEPLKIGLSQTEDASKRCRWIIFIMQLTVVLVLSSLWLQEDSNWMQLRFNAAQAAVKLLSCEPQLAYPAGSGYPPQNTTATGAAIPAQISREEVDTQSICSKTPRLTADEQKQALEYLGIWHYSLPQAQKNVADLQQLISTRMLGVTVPVLGIMFDINDLSVVAGLAFAILLSWFHFALRRQRDNVKKVFELARAADRETPNAVCQWWHLKTAYDLLAMTQVLTVPPAGNPDCTSISLGRRLSRLPNLIMWTAVLTQFIVVADDIKTMKYGDALGAGVSHFETAIASFLLAYLVYRSIRCFRLLHETYDDWSGTYREIHPETSFTAEKKVSGEKMALAFLLSMVAIHMIGERPVAAGQILEILSHALSPLKRYVLWFAGTEEWLTIFIVLPLMALLLWHAFRRPVPWVRAVAWGFSGMVVLDLIAHMGMILQGKLQPLEFQHTMVGLFSLPVVMLASLNMVSVLRTRAKKVPTKNPPHRHGDTEKPKININIFTTEITEGMEVAEEIPDNKPSAK